jgi:phosphatidate cytidylyltransferase
LEKFVTSLREKLTVYDSFTQRCIMAAILAPILLLCIFVGGILFTALMIGGAYLALNEWLALTQKDLPDRVKYAYYGTAILSILLTYFLPLKMTLLTLVAWPFLINELAKRDNFAITKWTIGGVIYIALPVMSIVWLRKNGYMFSMEYQWAACALLFLMTWAVDTGAYLLGRELGGPKIAPSISPSKTWSGLAGGMAASAVTSCFLAGIWQFHYWGVYLVLGLFMAIVAQAGDFFESWVKRRAGVKDSGTLIPGHGGILDRVDGLLAAAPIFAFLAYCLS